MRAHDVTVDVSDI